MFWDSARSIHFLYPKIGRRELGERAGEALFWAVSGLIISSGLPYWPLFLLVFPLKTKLKQGDKAKRTFWSGCDHAAFIPPLLLP